MKNKYNIFLLIVILFFAFSDCANGACYNKPSGKLNIRFNYGKVSYINNKSNSQFPQKPYSTVMGLTVSDLKRQSSANTQIESDEHNNFCVYINELNVEVGYPKIDVYIDKKYRPGSCNYNVVKDHENYHVRVQQEGLKFFAPKIKIRRKYYADFFVETKQTHGRIFRALSRFKRQRYLTRRT